MAVILKVVISPYLSRKSSDFDENWCANTLFDSENCHVSNFTILASFVLPQWVKLFPHKLPSLLLPWYEKFTLCGRDPDGMKYIDVNHKTANINVQTAVYTGVNNDL